MAKQVPPFEREVLAFVDEHSIEARPSSCVQGLLGLDHECVEVVVTWWAGRHEACPLSVVDDSVAQPVKAGDRHERRVRSVFLAASIDERAQVVRQRGVERQHEDLATRRGERCCSGCETERLAASGGSADAPDAGVPRVGRDVLGIAAELCRALDLGEDLRLGQVALDSFDRFGPRDGAAAAPHDLFDRLFEPVAAPDLDCEFIVGHARPREQLPSTFVRVLRKDDDCTYGHGWPLVVAGERKELVEDRRAVAVRLIAGHLRRSAPP